VRRRLVDTTAPRAPRATPRRASRARETTRGILARALSTRGAESAPQSSVIARRRLANVTV
jgi:hypothetical protein